MSLVTLERSSPSPHESENEDLLSISSYEGFVARDHYALCLSPRPFTSLGPGRSGDQLRIFSHLKKLMKILRNDDKLRMVVELENNSARRVTKYLVIVATNGHMATEETIVLGTEQEDSSVRISLVLPLWRDTEIKLDGDGGFSVHTGDRHQVFKPSSVQSMWAALQMLYKATKDAQAHNYYVGGLSHTWMSYYSVMLTTDGAILNEWNLLEDVETFRPDSPIYSSDVSNWNDNRMALEKVLICKLREVMLGQDLEEVTSKQLRLLVEKEMNMDLKEYRGFLDQHMLRILGQMERPSQIFDYLFLGSEWNASNLPELKEIGVKYILNISREIDNFYPEEFKYLNIRLYDLPNSELIKHWDKTYTFLKEAKTSGKKVLVHCKMGISRSAATVMAYAMKEYKMSLKEALHHVKSKRNIANPNDGFLHQLEAYEGILKARHNELWGKQAPSRPLPLALQRIRSLSEPNLPDILNRSNSKEEEQEFFMDEGDMLHSSSNHLDHNTKGEPPHHHAPFSSSSSHIPSHSMPIDKTQNIRNFLASLPNVTVEDDQGLGDNIMCNSESGSGYSSPVSSPTDEDHLHSRYNKLAKEIKNESKSRSGQCEMEAEGEEDNVEEEDMPSQQNQFKEEEGSLSSSSSVGTDERAATYVVNPESPENSPTSSQRDYSSLNTREDALTAQTTERHQPVAQIPVLHGMTKAFSLPRDMECTAAAFSNYKRVPLPVSEDTQEDTASIEGESDLKNSKKSTTEAEVEETGVQSEANPTAKVDGLDIQPQMAVLGGPLDVTGPIKVPQIQSVPERIKEIEEMNSQKVSSKSNGVSADGSVPPQDKDSKCDFFIPDEGMKSGNRESATPSMTRTPSGHSICSSTSLSGGEEELKQLTYKSPPVITTRHGSLSPKPPPQESTETHVRTASCSLLPLNPSPLQVSESPVIEPIPVTVNAEIGQLGTGAVKARVMDIEERNRDDKSSSADELSSVRRHSTPPFQTRPSSSNDMMGVESSRYESKDLKRLAATQRRPSSDIVLEHTRSTNQHQRRETTPPALFSAWSKLITDVEDPPLPVQDLKKKFEDSDAVSIGSSVGSSSSSWWGGKVKNKISNLRRSQSLRDVESPGKTRLRLRGRRLPPYFGEEPPPRVVRTESPCSQNRSSDI